MFCPEDGIECELVPETEVLYYCGMCDVFWQYDSDNGAYYVFGDQSLTDAVRSYLIDRMGRDLWDAELIL